MAHEVRKSQLALSLGLFVALGLLSIVPLVYMLVYSFDVADCACSLSRASVCRNVYMVRLSSAHGTDADGMDAAAGWQFGFAEQMGHGSGRYRHADICIEILRWNHLDTHYSHDNSVSGDPAVTRLQAI